MPGTFHAGIPHAARFVSVEVMMLSRAAPDLLPVLPLVFASRLQ